MLDAPVGGTISTNDSPLYAACQEFVERDDEVALLPILCTGFTDSHYMRAAFGSVAYGIWPSRSTPYDVRGATVHGYDERVHADDLVYATQFHIEFCRSVLAGGRGPA